MLGFKRLKLTRFVYEVYYIAGPERGAAIMKKRLAHVLPANCHAADKLFLQSFSHP
jgi:hypothetical protein